MPTYTPLNLGVSLQSVQSELLEFALVEPGIDGKGFYASFLLHGTDNLMLSVWFGADAIIRILDEFPLSTEFEETENVGLVPYTFAYTVTGTQFEKVQSEVWRQDASPLTHYRFATGNMCLDVLVKRPAQFEVVPIPSHLQWAQNSISRRSKP